MKVTDYNVVAAMVDELLPEKCPDLLEKIGAENAQWCVMGIYLMNDQTTGYGQDFNRSGDGLGLSSNAKLSVISSPNRISVIDCGDMSYYTDNIDVCGSEDLEEDITNILVWIQTCFDRLSFRLT